MFYLWRVARWVSVNPAQAVLVGILVIWLFYALGEHRRAPRG